MRLDHAPAPKSKPNETQPTTYRTLMIDFYLFFILIFLFLFGLRALSVARFRFRFRKKKKKGGKLFRRTRYNFFWYFGMVSNQSSRCAMCDVWCVEPDYRLRLTLKHSFSATPCNASRCCFFFVFCLLDANTAKRPGPELLLLLLLFVVCCLGDSDSVIQTH